MVVPSLRLLGSLLLALLATVAHATSPHRTTTALRLPLAFEANRGQVDARVPFVARGPEYALFVRPDEVVVRLHRARAATADARVGMRFVGGAPDPMLTGEMPLAGRANYLLGADPSRWRTDVPLFGRVRCAGVYPGVDAVFYGTDEALEYDLIVAPGVDPATITLGFRGAERVTIADDGTLVLHTPDGDLVQRKPSAHQTIDGVRRPVAAAFVLGGAADGEQRVRFALGPHDPTQPLVIDPVLGYATYLGGPSNNAGRAIAVDANGNAYVTGTTTSATFPTLGGLTDPNDALQGSQDAFVTKLDANGALVYSTYLGGSGSDGGNGIAVDDQGSAYVAGETDSVDFPTANPLPAPNNALQNTDGFVTKLNAAGNALVYSTFLGGSAANERANAIAVDDSRNAYVVGETFSDDFPVAGTLANNVMHGLTDAFVSKLATNGSSLVYSLYLGGSSAEKALGVAVRSGEAYVTGRTQSSDFPVASGLPAPNNGLRGFSDGFVTKVNAAGNALVYSTYLSGSGDVDDGNAIAVDGDGNAYVGGKTVSSNFLGTTPATGALPAPNASFRGGADGYVVKIAAAGTSVDFLAFLGGSSNGGADEVNGIALDANRNVYVTGRTDGNDFPVKNGLPLQNRRGGNNAAAIVAEIAAAGNSLVYSTYLGGTRGEIGRAIAVDANGNAYVTGETTSNDFPVKNAAQATHGSGDFNADAFIAKIAGTAPPALAYTTGNVFVSAVDFGEVREYTPSGTFVRALPLPSGSVAGGTYPAGIAFDSTGHLFVADRVQNAIFEFDATGGLVGTFASGINAAPQSLVFDAADTLFIGTIQGANDVLVYASNGTPGTPHDVFVHATGSMWIDLAADQRTLLYTSNTEDVATYDLVTRTQGADLFIDADGIRDYGVRALADGAFVANGDVVRVNASGTVTKTYTAVPAASLFVVSRDPDGQTLWSASEGIGNVTPGAVYAFDVANASIVHQFTGPVGVDRVPVGGLAVFGELTEARNGEPPATPTPMPTLTPAPEVCDDCIDNDFDGAVDRKDSDCAPRADGTEQGLGSAAAGKAIAKCTKALAKAGAKAAGSRQKHLQKCLLAAFACAQQKPGDAACTAKATATCGKELGKFPGENTKLAAGIQKACSTAPLTIDDLKNAAGLGYGSETGACADRGVAALTTVADVASCVLAEHACRAENLVGSQVPRAAELLMLAGRNPASELPCLGAPADGAGAHLGAAAKAAVKCQKAITKAAAKLASARMKTFQKCAAAVMTCVQVKPADAKCRAKASAACAKLVAKLTATGSGAASKLAAAVGKGCGKAPLTVTDANAVAGLGFDAAAGECAALEAPPLGSLAALADCVARRHACRVDQMLENELPRLREILAIANVTLD
ncbi:MAG: SBBP repeat-containing protein [Myxococcales bacterium]|nr:SBBP repeat-containing protein [Myxococcales bacterium]